MVSLTLHLNNVSAIHLDVDNLSRFQRISSSKGDGISSRMLAFPCWPIECF
jgi:hypothetical protein